MLRDGRPAPRNTAFRNLYYPMCFRDSSEIRRPALALPGTSVQELRVDATPARAQDHGVGSAQGAVAVTGNPDLPRPDAASSHSAYWWYYNQMHVPNKHFAVNWAQEDELLKAVDAFSWRNQQR